MTKTPKPIHPKTLSRVMRAIRAKAKPENMARPLSSDRAREMAKMPRKKRKNGAQAGG